MRAWGEFECGDEGEGAFRVERAAKGRVRIHFKPHGWSPDIRLDMTFDEAAALSAMLLSLIQDDDLTAQTTEEGAHV